MKKYRIDFVMNTITISADFAEALNDPTSEEYKFLLNLRRDFPTIQVINRTHATPKVYKTKSGERLTHNQFKGLTYEKMEKFLSVVPNGEAFKAEYDKARSFAKEANVNAYPLISKWFVKQFPEYRRNPLCYIHEAPNVIPFETIKGETTKLLKASDF